MNSINKLQLKNELILSESDLKKVLGQEESPDCYTIEENFHRIKTLVKEWKKEYTLEAIGKKLSEIFSEYFDKVEHDYTSEWATFLKEKELYISVSIDGSQDRDGNIYEKILVS